MYGSCFLTIDQIYVFCMCLALSNVLFTHRGFKGALEIGFETPYLIPFFEYPSNVGSFLLLVFGFFQATVIENPNEMTYTYV